MIITATFALSACTIDTHDLSEQVSNVEATSSSTPATSLAAPSTSERGRQDNTGWFGFAQLWSNSEDTVKVSKNAAVIASVTESNAVAEQEAQIHREMLSTEQATAQADHETGNIKER